MSLIFIVTLRSLSFLNSFLSIFTNLIDFLFIAAERCMCFEIQCIMALQGHPTAPLKFGWNRGEVALLSIKPAISLKRGKIAERLLEGGAKKVEHTCFTSIFAQYWLCLCRSLK